MHRLMLDMHCLMLDMHCLMRDSFIPDIRFIG